MSASCRLLTLEAQSWALLAPVACPRREAGQRHQTSAAVINPETTRKGTDRETVRATDGPLHSIKKYLDYQRGRMT